MYGRLAIGGHHPTELCFFFSSRRRHTRLQGDWSSDVCSSDLKIGPKLMGIDLREAAREATAALHSDKAGSAGEADGITSAARLFDVRAYRVENAQLLGKTIAELEALPKKSRIFVLRGRSGDTLFDLASQHRIRAGDIIAVMARFEVHAARGDVIGPEVSDPDLLDIPLQVLDVVMTNRGLDDRSLAELSEDQLARGVF